MSLGAEPTMPGDTHSPDAADSAAEAHKKRGHHDVNRFANEQVVFPKNRLVIVFTGFMLATFLAALDLTVVTTALPTIAADLQGSGDYSWVGSCYTLAAASTLPLYGQLSQLVGRKPALFGAIIFFLIGSALCGAAQNMNWLIGSRVVQGVGGGGILGMVQIIMGDIVALEQRGKYGGALSMTWGIASVLGPVIGGALAQHASWRWCFYINLPVGVFAVAVIATFLKLHKTPRISWCDFVHRFDFIGMICIIAGVVLFLLGLSLGSQSSSWKKANVLSFMIVGIVLVVCGSINECITTRDALIPPRIFRTRTTSALIVSVFLQSFMFYIVTYYLPIYYQGVTGSSATISGLQMLPYAAGSSFVSVASGLTIAHTGDYVWVLRAGWAACVIGNGLMTLLGAKTSRALQEIFPFIASIGVGPLFQGPIIAMQAAMPSGQMTSTTTAFMLCRNLGSSVGISVGGAIVNNEIRRRLSRIPGYRVAELSDLDYRSLTHIEPESLRREVLQQFSDSLRAAWIATVPIAGVGFLLMLAIKKYSLKRRNATTVEVKPQHQEGDVEDGAGAETETRREACKS